MQKIVREFTSRFGSDPLVIRSPGRVNLIGEHTDYNDGFVLPAAVDKVVALAMAPNASTRVRIYAMDMEQPWFESDIGGSVVKTDRHWPNYFLGVIDGLAKQGAPVGGFDCVIGGNIPLGAGLSSSAAVTCGAAYGLSVLFNGHVGSKDLARIGQKAEHDFAGVQCGIMDHFANLFGQKGAVIRLDCRSLEYEYFPFSTDTLKVVLLDTGVRRELASTGYNERREQCEEGVRIVQRSDPGVLALRDVSLDLLETSREKMDPVVYKRCRFVIEENGRVLAACRALADGDYQNFGKMMYASHSGLRDLYEVSCRELDLLVESAEGLSGVLGSRMMGGGFGGCTINIIREELLDNHVNRICDRYRTVTGEEPAVHVVEIADGTGHDWSEHGYAGEQS